MRRFIASLLISCASIIALAQTSVDGTLKFLGIPVEGAKQDVISQLKAKGFQYFSHNDCLVGQFNGHDVELHVITNHGNVYRIVVEYPSVSYESQIINEYNALLGQFEKNRKYVSPRKHKRILETEHIAYEMSANNKQYGAGYYYISPDLFSEDEIERIHQVMDDLKGMSMDEIEKQGDEIASSLMIVETPDEATTFMKKWKTIMEGRVWFEIGGKAGDFRIAIFYDNAKNQPDGEDL